MKISPFEYSNADLLERTTGIGVDTGKMRRDHTNPVETYATPVTCVTHARRPLWLRDDGSR
jgi:hypothetical protein